MLRRPPPLRRLLLATALVLAPASVPTAALAGEMADAATGGKPPAPQARWLDTRPRQIEADWVQLKSGEWLRGKIISFHNKKLEFDSDELKEQSIKLEKIRYLKSARSYSLRFESADDRLGKQTSGKIEIHSGEVYVSNDYHDERYALPTLISIARNDSTELGYWQAKATLSLNIRRGNTEQTDFAAQLHASRRTTLSRLTLKYLGNFTSTDNSQTANNHRLNANYDIFITTRLFWSAVFGEYFRDPFQNISHRLLAGTGIGYNLIDSNKTDWHVSGGPGIKETRYTTVEAGRDPSESTLFLALKSDFDTELNSKVDLIATYSINLANRASGGYTHHALGSIETELNKWLDFDVSLVWDRVQYPAKTAAGITPKQDDFKLLVGLSFDL